MRTIKNNLISILSLSLSLGLMSGFLALRTAQASRADRVPTLQIDNLSKYRGQYLHVIYAVKRATLIGISPIPHLEKIAGTQALQVNDDQLTFPSVLLEKEPFRGSYNVIVFVVSGSSQITWINSSQGMTNQYQYLQKIERDFIEGFVSQNGPDSVLNLKF